MSDANSRGVLEERSKARTYGPYKEEPVVVHANGEEQLEAASKIQAFKDEGLWFVTDDMYNTKKLNHVKCSTLTEVSPSCSCEVGPSMICIAKQLSLCRYFLLALDA